MPLSLNKPSTRIQAIKQAKAANDMATPVSGCNQPQSVAKDYFYSHSAIKQGKVLAIGIHKPLIDGRPEGIAKHKIRKLLFHYVNSTKYRQQLAKGGYRYTLDGKPAGMISPLHMEEANANH